ncbi:MAG: hypothetical protein AAF721_32650 [Myxococcota bacterium]
MSEGQDTEGAEATGATSADDGATAPGDAADATSSIDGTTSESGSGSGEATAGFDAPEGCVRQECHYDCFDESECSETWSRWDCDLPDLCGMLLLGDGYDATEFRERSQCLLTALRDGTVGRVRFADTHVDGELGQLGPSGIIHILPDRQVVVDLTALEYCGIGKGMNYERRSMVLDLVPADAPDFDVCLGSASISMLKACLGFDRPVNDPTAFPWLEGTCTDALEHDACPS